MTYLYRLNTGFDRRDDDKDLNHFENLKIDCMTLNRCGRNWLNSVKYKS